MVPSRAAGAAARFVAAPGDCAAPDRGDQEEAGPLAKALNSGGFTLPPLPNLFFPRDIGMVIGKHAVVGAMRHRVRWTEELLIATLFRFHPALANGGAACTTDPRSSATPTRWRAGTCTCCGPISAGRGLQRALLTRGAGSALRAGLRAAPTVTDVIVVVMPKEPTAIHLDMLFTQVDHELCVVYPPYFLGPERRAVLHRRKGEEAVHEMPDFFAAVRAVGLPLQPVFAGGARRVSQEREQWTSGCNLMALRPGVVVSYRRNEATLDELKKTGFRLVSSVDFVAFDDWLDTKHRTVVTIEGETSWFGAVAVRAA